MQVVGKYYFKFTILYFENKTFKHVITCTNSLLYPRCEELTDGVSFQLTLFLWIVSFLYFGAIGLHLLHNSLVRSGTCQQ